MIGICGADCSECELFKSKNCQGCKNTNGCPFGKKCWIAKYIEVGGSESFEKQKELLLKEINSLGIEGMPIIKELYPLHGASVNLEYSLPNKKMVKFLNDEEAYLGNQIECEFNDEEIRKNYGVVANMNFILVVEYENSGDNPEIIIYKKR